MKQFLTALKDAVTGNYTVDSVQSAAIEPEPFEIAYSVREMNEIFQRGMNTTRTTVEPQRSDTV